jgi:glycosyltransferase involved in cell wall biosynthesis
MDKAALPPVYRKADVFVLPAREDGMPSALLEAMAAGLPIITSKVAGASEAVIDGINGLLVEKDDIDGWVKALTAIADNPARREMMGRASRVRAETYFSWTAVTRTWLDVLEHAVSDNAGVKPHATWRF